LITLTKWRIEIGRDIAAPVKQVWECITDTSRWCEWGPSISAVQCEQQCIKENSSGRVQTVLGIWLPFVITSFEECRFWSWRVGGIPATGHALEKRGENGVRLTFDMPIWAFAYVGVCYLALRRIEKICREPEIEIKQ
jgi:hypothetical protein